MDRKMVGMSNYPFVYLSIHPSIYLSFFSVESTDLSVCQPIHLSVFPSICLPLYLSMQPSIHHPISVYVSICLSFSLLLSFEICPFPCLSICLSSCGPSIIPVFIIMKFWKTLVRNTIVTQDRITWVRVPLYFETSCGNQKGRQTKKVAIQTSPVQFNVSLSILWVFWQRGSNVEQQRCTRFPAVRIDTRDTKRLCNPPVRKGTVERQQQWNHECNAR